MVNLDVLRMAAEAARAKPDWPSAVPPTRQPPPDRTLDLVAASLAAGIIAAGGEAVTAEEAVGVWREVRRALALLSS